MDHSAVSMTDEGVVSRTWSRSAPLVVAAYTVLGALLLLTRFVWLGHSFWFDELYFVEHFVREGPGEILAGPYLSHELMAIVCWATSSIAGESETAFRMWSVVPFVAGVTVVTAWLHSRVDALTGLLFLFLATVSPLLLDITRQARGYGLAFLAMSIVVVAALEATRDGRTAAVVAMCAAGVVGTWTLPQLSIGFLATGAVVAIERRVRRPTVIGLGLSVAAIAAWYAPHVGQVQAASQIEDGLQIHTTWLITAPIDQVVLPALIWIEGTTVVPGVVWLPFVALCVLVMGFSPLVRELQSALVLVTGTIATVVVLWIGQAYVIPRYLSFLLVPAFVLLASGASAILRSTPSKRSVIPTALCLTVVVVLIVNFASIAPDVVRLPREANRDAAEVIAARAVRGTSLLATVRHTNSIEFYLRRPLPTVAPSQVVHRVCDATRPVVYVRQVWAITLVRVPCLKRGGVERYRLRQYARGGEIDVWIIPPGRVEPGS